MVQETLNVENYSTVDSAIELKIFIRVNDYSAVIINIDDAVK
jgi:hypothetical protein